VPALTVVLDTIARAVLGDADDMDQDAVTFGTVTLRAHQRDALRRVRASIARVGGALLADEPGLGKTFVALALAREFPDTIIVAPAGLRTMWRRAAAAAGVKAPFVSLETLSRRDANIESRMGAKGGLVIVDEAHHACNPATARYARLARLMSYRRVLLLTATPVRNRRTELAALLALFMGPRAYVLDDATRSRCIVRRGGDASLRPAIDGPHWLRVRSIPRLGAMIAALPPPLPALDGRQATALLAMTLARCWASSLAAFDAALRRRLQHGAALAALLDEGRVPTRDELRAWVVGDDAVQLAFPMLALHETPDAARLRVVLEAHLDAVRALRARIRTSVSRDSHARAQLLLDLRRRFAGSRIVAFTAHAATAEALYRALSRERGVALLTARGARTAGGSRPRADVIDALASEDRGAGEGTGAGSREDVRAARARDDISLVITTDLLSEGVNLQGASVIVHLDVPWTPAGLDQRVGRAARMGSHHACVHVHGIAPPAAAERLLALERRLTRKHAEQVEAARAPRATEQLRALVHSWRGDEPRDEPSKKRHDRDALKDVRVNVRHDVQDAEHVNSEVRGPLVAHVRAARPGFIAVVETRGESEVVCGALHGNRRWKLSDAPGDLCAMALAVRPRDAGPNAAFESHARAALARWLDGRRARESSGGGGVPSRARRLLLARIDSAVRRAGAHTRAALAERIEGVRACIDRAVSAGAERTLDELARSHASQPSGLESWLAACETRLADGGASRPAPRENDAVVALLLLRGPA
jgi:hypothetical protein